ncbi:MAG: DUF262 domain-containing protein [Bacteroidales bacterium]
MSESKIELRSLNKLLEHSYFIPSYQRGYRWTKTEVEALLNDIWSFAINPPKQESSKVRPFYCLQPIVLKLISGEENEWEVIDGQQRLTTIFLILKNLEAQIERDQKNLKRLHYETRKDSENFLQTLNEEKKEKNIDYYHIWNANHTIQQWFRDKANTTDYAAPKALFAPTFLTDTKVIWYEAEQSSDSIDIFTRLNIGKIPLTNAELIKALFLQKGNFSEEKATLKQIQIASEWDIIEKTLQNDAFWYFIYNPKNPLKYDNRIEYIFDLMMKKKKDDEDLYTFHKFYNEFSVSSNLNEGKPNIDHLWSKIKKFFLTFEEWYNNKELYHLVGYLIEFGADINILKDESANSSKSKFKDEYLKFEVKKKVNCLVDELSYKGKHIKEVLLLFNIQIILATENADIRFPFFRYKNEESGWDIEHIRSQTDKQITKDNRKEWAIDVLEYFTGLRKYKSEKTIEKQKTEIKKLTKEAKKGLASEYDLANRLLEFVGASKTEDEIFDKLYTDIVKFFEEDKEFEDKDGIGNLTLLDAVTNRSYGNTMFPIKRKTIIYNDMNGVFVPIGTKNVFLKSYSKKLGNVMHWTENDAEAYRSMIKKTLKEYLPNQENDNDK